MNPSQTGSHSSMNQPQGQDEVGSNNAWFYPDANKNPPQPSPSSTSSMIGPTSTFYNPNEGPLHQTDSHTAQYQQWMDSFNSQQQQSNQQVPPMQSPYRRDVMQPQQQAQPQYPYMQGEYPSSAISQYSGSSSLTATQSNIGGASSYQTGDMYSNFYPGLVQMGGSAASSPDQTHSYHVSTPESVTLHSFSTTPDPVYQQQQSQPGYTQQSHGAALTQPTHEAPPLRQAHPRPSVPIQISQFQQPQSQPRFLPPQQQQQRNDHASQSKSQSSTSHPTGTLTTPSTTPWNTKQGNVQMAQPFKVPRTVSGGSRSHVPSNAPPPPLPPRAQNAEAGPSSSSYPVVSGSTSTVTPEKAGGKRKRAKKEDTSWSSGRYLNDDESDSDDDDGTGLGMSGGISVGMGGLGVVGRGSKRERGTRHGGACTHCKKLKMKCDMPPHENTCKRCRSGGHVCIVEGRKPRTAPNKREYLLAQIRQKDAIIESLLKQLHNPYIATPLSIASYRMATSPSDQNNKNVLAWLDRLQSSVRDAGKESGSRAFLELRNLETIEDDSDIDSESRRGGGQTKDDGGDDTDEAAQDAEKFKSSLPDAHVPLGLIADLSLSNTKASKKKEAAKEAAITEEDLNDDNVGVANETYFMPGPATDLGMRATLIEQHSPPEILVHGLVKPEDVDKLFQIFYERVNPFISLLDPVLHTPASTFARCPFLFTVVCAISSRYYAEKSEIYPIAMHFAKHSAANALIDGWKSVELCQAYILMSIYAVPARRWEEDRSWLYTGLAIRIATDLNLHHAPNTKPQSESQEREILNKTRVWMICFNLDRSTATQFGKPSTIKEDYIMRNAKDWYKRSQYNHNYDVHLCAYSALLQIVARFHDEIFSDTSSPSGLNKKVDFRSVTLAHDANLTKYHEEWSKRFKEDSDPNDPGSVFRCSLLPFLVGYSRLVMFSFGFQQAFQRGFEHGDSLFFTTCLESAKSVIETMIDGLAPSGYMRYAPDGHFIFASFASAFLLKLLKPEFSAFLVKEQENEIFDCIGRLIQTLSSPKIAIDDRHTPKLYARFLAGLLSRHRRDGATVGRLQTNPPGQSQVPGSGAPPAGSSSASFPLAPSTGGGQTSDQTFSPAPGGVNQAALATPIYTPEATFSAATGAIEFATDFDMTYSGGFSDEEMLATMQAIKNPAWWSNMMMPGFSWPEGSPSPPAVNTVSPLFTNINMPIPGIAPSFSMFQGTQVMM